MEVLLLVLWLAQTPTTVHMPYGQKIETPEKTRGGFQETSVKIIQDGPLAVPAEIFWKAFTGLIGFNVLAIWGVAKHLWKKHNDEVSAIQKSIEDTNEELKGMVLYETYQRDKKETRDLISSVVGKLEQRHIELGEKVDHQIESLGGRVDRNHQAIMDQLISFGRQQAK